MINTQSEIVDKIVKTIQSKKEELIKQAFLDKGYRFDKTTSNDRFKRVIVEKHPDKEEWWLDNGTSEGLKVITIFEPKQSVINYNDDINVFNINCDLKFEIH